MRRSLATRRGVPSKEKMPSHEDIERSAAQFRLPAPGPVPTSSSLSPSSVVQSAANSSKGSGNPLTAGLLVVHVWAVAGPTQPRSSSTLLTTSTHPPPPGGRDEGAGHALERPPWPAPCVSGKPGPVSVMARAGLWDGGEGNGPGGTGQQRPRAGLPARRKCAIEGGSVRFGSVRFGSVRRDRRGGWGPERE